LTTNYIKYLPLRILYNIFTGKKLNQLKAKEMKTVKELTPRQQFNITVKDYIIGCIDSEAYEVETTTEAEKLQFLYNTFVLEYWYDYNKKYYKGSIYKCFEGWIQGLPSVFNIDFENYRIIELAKAWGSIPQDADDRREDKILENWFNFITVKTFQLFRKYKIA
jgi:hypothetical protein